MSYNRGFKMYLEYDTDQTPFGRRKGISWRDIGSYRPTWLIRVHDMKKVPGTEAVSGYCALSYSWSCSGDIVDGKDGKKDIDDKGRHEIITHQWNTQTNERETITEYVKFDKAVQYISKDFGIDYIWYDKRCINQDDKHEKIAEIKKMHKTYKNALFSVVLIPNMNSPTFPLPSATRFKKDPFDAYCLQAIINSEWCTRMWTLEEAVLSQNMVFVGRTVHFWSCQMSELFAYSQGTEHTLLFSRVQDLCGNEADAAKILHFAHTRTSTKEHDKIFALANIYADTVKIDVAYDKKFEEVTMQFYTGLASVDHTILCFGKPLSTYVSTMNTFPLPSWTGVDGAHVLLAKRKFTLKSPQTNIVIANEEMHVTCKYLTVTPNTLTNDTAGDVDYLENNLNIQITHCVPVAGEEKSINDDFQNSMSISSEDTPVDDEFEEGSEDESNYSVYEDNYQSMAFLSLTDEYCKECYVLDISFSLHFRFSILRPVVKYDETMGAHKAIGVHITYLLYPSLTEVLLSKLGKVNMAETFIIK